MAVHTPGVFRDDTALLELKQSGNDLTGSVEPNPEERMPIPREGIESGKIRLDVKREKGAIHFDMVLSEERLRGEAKLSGGEHRATAVLDLKPVKLPPVCRAGPGQS